MAAHPRPTPPADTPTIGLIGVGLMGEALAERCLRSGFPVVGFDLLEPRRHKLQELGGRATTSAATVVQESDWLIYSVMTTADVVSSLSSCEASLRPGLVVIDTSTGHPDEMADLAARLATREVLYLDATIAGNSAETKRGEVLVLVGGPTDGFNRCRAFFDCFARRTFHLGPSGAGARMKLVFNLVLGLHRAVLGEALVFADRLGFERETALDILKQGTTYSHVMDNKGGKMLSRDFAPQAKLQQHLKDVRLILELGRLCGADLPLSRVHSELLERLSDGGQGELDNSAIIKAFE